MSCNSPKTPLYNVQWDYSTVPCSFRFMTTSTLYFFAVLVVTSARHWEMCGRTNVETKVIAYSADGCDAPDDQHLPGRSGGRPLQYVHVPKTGGASVQSYLRSIAQNHSIRVQYHDGEFGSTAWDQKACMVFGHRPIGWATGFSDLKPLYIVTLREPIAFAVCTTSQGLF